MRTPLAWQVSRPELVRGEAEDLSRRARELTDALALPDEQQRTVAVTRLQIRDLRERLDGAERELNARSEAGLPVDGILLRIARMARGINDVPAGNTRIAMYLANCVQHTLAFQLGVFPRSAPGEDAPRAPFNPTTVAALGMAARTQGIANVALKLFAEIFPEYAVKLDRHSLDRLATAWQTLGDAGDGGKWSAIARVCKERFGFSVQPESVKRELGHAQRDAYPPSRRK
jgi:hypothetical protein